MASPIITELEAVKTLIAFAERAVKNGLNLSADLQQCIDDPQKMQRMVRYLRSGCPSRGTGISYDAATVGRTLKLSCKCSDSAPKADDGEIIVYYGGWSLGDLFETDKVVNRLSNECNEWRTESGYYRILLPVLNSDRKNWNQQAGDTESSMLARQYDGWQAIPTVVGATALALHFGVTGEDLLNGNYCRCDEALSDDDLAGLVVFGGRVHVGSVWDGDSSDDVVLVAARKV